MAGLITRIGGNTFKSWIMLGVALTISLALMATGNDPDQGLVSMRASGIFAALARPFGIFPEIIRLRSENVRLRQENARLTLHSSRADEAVVENQRLRELLEFREHSDLQLRPAEVLASDPMPGVHSLLLSVGERQGVGKHMAIISDQGLVGKIARVGPNTSVAQILLDRNVGAAVRLAICREDGITVWRGANDFYIEGVPSSAQVRLGESVITSGLDGIFPEGIPVGKIISTEREKGSLFLDVKMEPVVTFSRLEEVFVVLNNPSPLTAP